VQQRQLSSTLSASGPAQLAIVEYLKHGGYERHLRQLRKALSQQQAQMLEALRRYLPRGARVTQPDGGYFVWVELPAKVDSLQLYARAMDQGISLSPGPMFSAARGFTNCVRLNYGHPWSPQFEQGVRTLAGMTTSAD
jgi:DNA-binding transcriptional MocR family regulator